MASWSPDRKQYATWTRFHVPLSEDVLPIIKKTSSFHRPSPKWVRTFEILLNAPGHSKTLCGRAVEDPETVIMYTFWTSEEHYAAFKASPEYFEYWKQISQFSPPGPKPVEQLTVSNSPLAPSGRNSHAMTAITCQFRHPVSDETKEQVETMKGFYQINMGFTLQRQSYLNGQTRAWVVGSHETSEQFPPLNKLTQHPPKEGQTPDQQMEQMDKIDTLLWICLWTSPQKESQYKSNHHKFVDRFDYEIRILGCLNWVEEHVELQEAYL